MNSPQARRPLRDPSPPCFAAFFYGSTSAFGLFGAGSSSVPFLTGMIGLLVVVAAGHLVLLRRYPGGLFDLLLGLNRWGFRTVEQEDPAHLLNQLLAADPPTYAKGRLS